MTFRIKLSLGLVLVLTGAVLLGSGLSAASLAERLEGRILLQVEQNGEAWYIAPGDRKRHFLGRPTDAFSLMRSQGLGISNSDIAKVAIGLQPLSGADADLDGLSDIFEDAIGTDKNSLDTDNDSFADKVELENGFSPTGAGSVSIDNSFARTLHGEILLQVEQNGEAWYVSPVDSQRYFLGRPHDAFTIMRNLGLGITDNDIAQIPKAGETAMSDDESDDDEEVVAKSCIVTGCSSHVCSDEAVSTTCEFKAEYACYETATCGLLESGECGWIETDELTTCIWDAQNPTPVVKEFNVSGFNFAFSLGEIKVNKGDTVKINLTSSDGFHDWVVDEFSAATARVNTGDSTSVEFVADQVGSFEYYCSVGNHRAQGMFGTLVVEE